MRRRVETAPADLRARFCAAQVEAHADYCAALGSDLPNGRLSALLAGEAVEVAGWELSGWWSGRAPFKADDRLRLEVDGSVTVVRRANRHGLFG